tara:strand:- start:118 stop:390 length:273 start_codon:yes stop_codon:yes gene_type:complete
MAKYAHSTHDGGMNERRRTAQNLRALKAKGQRRKAKRVARTKDEIIWLKLKLELAACKTASRELGREQTEEAKEAMARADAVLAQMRPEK